MKLGDAILFVQMQTCCWDYVKYIPNNRTVPNLGLGKTCTAQDLNNPNATLKVKKNIYLMKYPYKDISIDSITFIIFMST